jgi:hypothetical protein
MREDLLGYLLDALDDQERQRVLESLRTDPQLRRELEQLRQRLKSLDEESDDALPPRGLVDQTCDLIEAFDEAPEEIRARVVPHPPAPRRHRWAPCGRELHQAANQWSAADTLVAAGIFLAVALMFFPAIASSRFRSEVTACQYNLQQLGGALASYSEFNDGYFPRIPVQGNRAAAGVYGPLLYDGQFITDESLLICPTSISHRQVPQFHVPSLAELDQASGIELAQLQRVMGGSYGYTLGFKMDGRYCTPRNVGRGSLALLSDKPSLHLPASQSDNHGGRGQNVLFDDFRVEFMLTCKANDGFDNVFRSRRGFCEAGTDLNDSVIGPSFLRPIADY